MGGYVEGPRPFTVTADDRRGLIVVITTLLLIWIVLCYAVRIYLRVVPRLPVGWDDLALTIATVG